MMNNSLSTGLTAFLEAQGIPFELLMQEREATSIEEAAELRGIRPAQMLKTMLLRDMDHQYALACVPGDQSVDPKKVRSSLGWKRMTCVSSDQVEGITGYKVGTVTPLMLKRTMPILFDPSIQNEQWITISSGNRIAGIGMELSHLIDLCQPRFALITKSE